MVKIRVKLFASLRGKLPQAARGEAHVELGPGATLKDLMDKLDIAEEQASMILVNGEQVPAGAAQRGEVALKENDTVSIFPSLAGG